MGSKNAKTGKTPKGGTLWDLVVFEISYVVKASEFTPPQVRFGLGQVLVRSVSYLWPSKALKPCIKHWPLLVYGLKPPYQTLYIMVMSVKASA